MVKVALDAPAGTVTLAGRVATAVLLDESETTTPPAGAAPARVTVASTGVPPSTMVWLSWSEARLPSGSSSSVTPSVQLRLARMVTFVASATGCVVTENDALFAPSGTVTLAGTDASAGFVLPRATIAPPGGATELRVTVPWTISPPSGVFVLTVNPPPKPSSSIACSLGATPRSPPWVTPPYSPEIVTWPKRGLGVTVTVKEAVALPSGTVTVAGTVAQWGRLLASATVAPPAGARPSRVTVPSTVPLPNALLALSFSAARAVAGPGSGGGSGAGAGGAGSPRLSSNVQARSRPGPATSTASRS